MKHWVFDLDGTLVDSFSQYFETLTHIFNEYGVTFTDAHRLPALTESLPAFFDRILGPGTAAPALEKLRQMSSDDAARIRPFEGVETFLSDLKSNGAKIGVWTNRDFESAKLILQHSGLDRYVEEFVSGTCTVLRKPHPEGLLRIIDNFKADLSTVTMVGDHEHDVVAAKTAGVRGVRASWHSYWSVEPCPHTEHHFHDFSQFSDWAKRPSV